MLCAPGLSGCPNWGDTLIEQITGDAVHLLLRNQITGAQRIGLLNLGNAGFGGFNGCAGSANPCLSQIRNLPAQVSGNVIDIAGETFIPDRVWVLWAEGLTTPSATSETDNEFNGPSAASFEVFSSQSSVVTYRLSALDSNGALIGSIPLGTGAGSSGGSGGGNGPDIEVSPTSLDFGLVNTGAFAERSLIIRNTGQTDLNIETVTIMVSEPIWYVNTPPLPRRLPPAETLELKVRFQPLSSGVFQNTLVIRSNDPDEAMVRIPLTGKAEIASRQSTATLSVDRGCGAGYQIGDPISINFQTSHDAIATLKVRLPDGAERVLFAGPVRGGLSNTLRGVVGAPAGERRLSLEAVAGALLARAECAFSGMPIGMQDDHKVKIESPKDGATFSTYVPALTPLTIKVTASDTIRRHKIKFSVDAANSAKNASFVGAPELSGLTGDKVFYSQTLSFSPTADQADQTLKVVIIATDDDGKQDKITINIRTVGVKVWSATAPLQWSDFQGAVPDNSRFSAETKCDIDFVISDLLDCKFNDQTRKWRCTAKKKIDTRAVFINKQSWVKDPANASDALKKHEQGHFDICEIYRRKLEKKLKELLGGLEGVGEDADKTAAEKAALADLKTKTSAVADKVNKAIEDIFKAESAKQKEYDKPTETDHGKDATKQAAWCQEIQKALNGQNSPYFPDP
jgi:hypothetical protein